MRQPHKSKKPQKLPAVQQMVVDLLTKLREYAMSASFKCTGQQTVEEKGKPPTIVFYAAYPNGDYLCWFNDGMKFKMFALVNENLREIMECAAGDLAKVIEKVKELEKKIGKSKRKKKD